jgi:hypothetical protein
MGTMIPPSSAAPDPVVASSKQNSQGFLPAITDLATARSVGRQGAIAAFFCAAMTAFFAALAVGGVEGSQILNIDAWALIDAALFFIIGICIWEMSRVFAVSGLLLYLLERVFMWAENPELASKGILISIFMVFAFVNGIRGTFAFHRFRARADFAQTSNI